MNNTNPAYQEFEIQRHTKELEKELRQIQLEIEALAARHDEPSWAAHRLAHLAEWMIVTGVSLHQRYNHAAMHKGYSGHTKLAYGGASHETIGTLYE